MINDRDLSSRFSVFGFRVSVFHFRFLLYTIFIICRKLTSYLLAFNAITNRINTREPPLYAIE